jgi:hypothetical protein
MQLSRTLDHLKLSQNTSLIVLHDIQGIARRSLPFNTVQPAHSLQTGCKTRSIQQGADMPRYPLGNPIFQSLSVPKVGGLCGPHAFAELQNRITGSFR